MSKSVPSPPPSNFPMPQCLDSYGLKPGIAEYLEKMRCVARENCYNVSSFFSEHDPLEFGTVSESIFKSILQEKFLTQANLTPEILVLLTEFFLMPDSRVCYARFRKLMDSTENIADQLRECASGVALPQISKAPLLTCGKRVYGTEPCIPSILERIKTAYNRLGLDFFDLFRCCDPKCGGTVSEEKFKCILRENLLPESGLTERQLESITNYYRAYDDQIDYRRMGDMLNAPLSLQEQYLYNYATHKDQLRPPKAVNALTGREECKLKEIWFKIVSRADPFVLKYLHALFDKFAQRPSGDTSILHLKRFINYLRVDLVESEFQLICKKYATNDYQVNFLQLIEDLDGVFHAQLCQKEPPQSILGADGPPEMDYLESGGGGEGAGQFSQLWGYGACCGKEVTDTGVCLQADSSRFYEGGPVIGGLGRRPIYGSSYIRKRIGAHPGQGYAGDYALTPGAGLPSNDPARSVQLTPIVAGASESVELKALMERLQQFLYRFRVRAKEFFRDFDPLNSGTVSANRFRRALTMMGIGPLGRFDLSEGEFDALINYYRTVHDPDSVCWKRFDTDIESIFIQKGIEKFPTLLTPNPARIASLPNPGVTDPRDVPVHIRQLAKCALAKLKHRIFIEGCNLKYFFQGFDLPNGGHITRNQFKQALGAINYNFSPEELDAISVLYCDDFGFDYRKLMEDLEPQDKCSVGWYQRYKAARLYNTYSKPPLNPRVEENDLQNIMYKVQSRMVTHRPKVKQFFQDHDWINHDRIKILDFHRVLDVCGFDLTPREVEVLTCCFRSPHDPISMEWRCFQDTLENVFTVEHLDKGPRIIPHQWRPLKPMDKDKCLSPEEYCLYESGMRRLARLAYTQRIETRNVFKDFDIPHTGIVSEDQFHRALHTLTLKDHLTPKEYDAIVKRFSVVRGFPGCKPDVDYMEFLIQLDAIVYVNPISLPELSPTGVEWHKQLHPICPDC